MATYSTDLTTLTTAEAGTWTEFASPYNGGGTPASDGENYIQGTDCRSQTTGKAVGLEISIVFDYGSNLTFAADEVVIAWCFYAVGVNLETYANSGWRFGIGSSVSAWDWFKIGGSNYGRNPYGGWFNVAIDPTATQDGVIGGGNGGSYRYFGSVPYTLNEISKGTPSAMDAIRQGRGELIITSTGGSFDELAQYNDYNAGGTPPGTSSTSIDSGRHRFGLFQDIGGVYLWKGLLSFGTSGASVTFSDSNVTIIIDDTPSTYLSFNKIEVANASSSVTWTNVTLISTGTVSPGSFEMLADATVSLQGCSFNNMGSFILDSNASVNGCTFNSCGLITLNEGSIANSSILAPTVAADTGAVVDNRTLSAPAILSEYDGCTFVQGANDHHAIDFGTGVDENITLRNIEFTGFTETTGEDTNGAALRFLATTGSLTCSLVGCTVGGVAASASNFFKDDAAGIAVTLVFDTIPLKVTVVDATSGADLVDARVYLHKVGDTATVYFEDETDANGEVNDAIAYPGDTAVVGWVREMSLSGFDYEPKNISGTITSSGLDLLVELERLT